MIVQFGEVGARLTPIRLNNQVVEYVEKAKVLGLTTVNGKLLRAENYCEFCERYYLAFYLRSHYFYNADACCPTTCVNLPTLSLPTRRGL